MKRSGAALQEQWTVSLVEAGPLFARAAEKARRSGKPRLVSVSVSGPRRDPVDVFEAARARGERSALWQLPDKGVALVGVGAAAVLEGRGPDRFAEVARRWRALTEDATIANESGASPGGRRNGPGPGPVAMGAFAFAPGSAQGVWDGFGDGRLALPRVAYGLVDGVPWWTVNAVIQPGEDGQEAARRFAEDKVLWLEGNAFSSRTRGEARAEGRDGEPAGGVAVGFRSREGSRLRTEDVQPKAAWLDAVRRVAADIRAGRLEKAVLARSVRVPLSADFSLAAALRRIREEYPETYVFAVADQGSCFFGATPERIVHLAGDEAKVACMAGSVGRGATPEEDRRLGEWLLADEKNVEEHRVVLRSILQGLEPACDGIWAAASPGLRKLANVQHLYTPVRARAKPGVDVLELVSRVHPTPAIGGHPTEDALAAIAREEGMDRGWYAGPVGWMNAWGEGEFAVGLRSGLVLEGEARLFAGCGIMGDSDPESEYAEAQLKMQPMLRALEAGVR